MCQASPFYVPTNSAGLSEEVYCIRFSFSKSSVSVSCVFLMWFLCVVAIRYCVQIRL